MNVQRHSGKSVFVTSPGPDHHLWWLVRRLMFSSWSRTQRNMPRAAVGASLNLPMANLNGEAVHKTCFSCHEPRKKRDFVFTRYSP